MQYFRGSEALQLAAAESRAELASCHVEGISLEAAPIWARRASMIAWFSVHSFRHTLKMPLAPDGHVWRSQG